MKRSGLFITVLLSLFIFQSMWNVAAAFCVHESEASELSVRHFGHHFDEKKHHQLQNKSDQTSKITQYLDQLNDDDHSDHLPSLAHVSLVNHATEVDIAVSVFNIEDQFLDWNSLYKSPQLFLPKLPPITAPL